MRVLYIVNGLGFSQGMPIGGADKRVSQIGQRLINSGVNVSVLTTSEGERVLRDDGLSAEYFRTNQPFFWKTGWSKSLLGRGISYLYLTLFSCVSVCTDEAVDIIYPSSDYFFDLLPALISKFRWKKAKLVGIVHHHIDLPWQRRGGRLVNLTIFLLQRFDFLFLKFFDAISVPDNFEGISIKKILSLYVNTKKILVFRNGIDFHGIKNLPETEKKYEACFLGGLRPSKGIWDLVPIWQEVVKALPAAKLLVIGGGLSSNEMMIQDRVDKSQLTKNIIFAGVLPRQRLFASVKTCRVFINPSYEEGWGIALMEALACGLPAVAYDLPAFGFLSGSVVTVPIGDTDLMAQAVVRLLREPEVFEKYQKLGFAKLIVFDWNRVAETELSELLNLTKDAPHEQS